ncbi:sigma-70 family RNA polymerase sigma factor [Streptomyces sp. NPDC091201]|uniref:RNA polymerase sigma factor n=1 Tax=Streptomyces sp. NPDC091201 TaxID=3155190 RepID=UPI00344191FB
MSTDELLLIDGTLQDPDTLELSDFDAFFDKQKPIVLRKVLAALGRNSRNLIEGVDFEDIAQQAFLVVFEKWQRVGRLASPHAYLYTVAENLARKRFRQRSVPVSDAHLDAVLGHEPGPEAHLDRLLVLQAVKRLAPRQAQVVGLQLDGLDDTDIAAALNITTDAVRSHRRHAKIALRHPATAAHD